MATLQHIIVEKFLAKQSNDKTIPPEKIEQIRALLSKRKKLRPEDLVNIFTRAADGDVK